MDNRSRKMNNQDSRTRNSARNVVFGISNKLITIFLPFVTRTISIRFLGFAYVGLSTLFTSILSFLSVAELGFGSAVVYAMYKPIADNDYSLVGAYLAFIKKIYRKIGFAILCLGLLLIPFLPYLVNQEAPGEINIYLIYSLYLFNSAIGYFASGYRQSLLSAYQRTDIIEKISIVVMVFVRLLEIIVLYATKNYYLFSAVQIIGTVATNIYLKWKTKEMFPEIACFGDISGERKAEVKQKIGGLIGTKLNSIVVHQADVLVISSFLGLSILGKYGNYYYILSAVSGIIVVAFNAITASVGNKIATNTIDEVYKLYKKISFLNMWIVGWSAICMVSLYEPFIRLWGRLAGEDLLLSSEIAISLTAYFYCFQIQRTNLVFKDAAGLWYEDRYRPYLTMIINLVANIILVRIIGLLGVILSSIIAFLISVPWCNAVVQRRLFNHPSHFGLLEMIKNAFISILVGFVTYSLCHLFPDSLGGMAGRAIICVLFPNAVLYAIYRNNSDFREAIRLVRGFIR